MRRPRFSIRALLWLTLVVAAFLGGIGFEKERRRREDEQLLDRPFTEAEFQIWITQDQTLEDVLRRRRKQLEASRSLTPRE